MQGCARCRRAIVELPVIKDGRTYCSWNCAMQGPKEA